MQKLLFFSFIIFTFLTFFLSCQEAMAPQDIAQNENNGEIQHVISPTDIPEPCDCEPRTPGFWKNHPEEWPEDASIGWSIGGEYYTKAEIIEIMNSPVKNDKRITLFKALTAAWLNYLDGCDVSCIAKIGNEADEMMGIVGRLPDEGVKERASGLWWKKVEFYYLILDDYNNNGCPN